MKERKEQYLNQLGLMKCEKCHSYVRFLEGKIRRRRGQKYHIQLFYCDCKILLHDKTSKIAFVADVTEKKRVEEGESFAEAKSIL